MVPLFRTSELYPHFEDYPIALSETLTLVDTRIVVLVDDNPHHHRTNFNIRMRDNNEGGRRGDLVGGCPYCGAQMVQRVRVEKGFSAENDDLAARLFIVDNGGNGYFHIDDRGRRDLDGPGADIHRTVRDEHRNNLTLGHLTDLKYTQESGDKLATSLKAVNLTPLHRDYRAGTITTPGRGEHFAIRVGELNNAIAVINALAANGTLDVVNTIGHGFDSGFHLGNVVTRKHGALPVGDRRVDDFVSQIADSLSTDVRFVLYACSTAGDNKGIEETYCLCQKSDSAAHSAVDCRDFRHFPVAAHLLKALYDNGKADAEVWGHIKAGDAMAKPHWVRFRMDGTDVQALSLLDVYRGQVGPAGFGGFRGNLNNYFEKVGYPEPRRQADGYPDSTKAIWYIPHWPVGFEHADFSAAPNGARILSAVWDAPVYSNGARLCDRRGSALCLRLRITVADAVGHRLQIIPALSNQNADTQRECWVLEDIVDAGQVSRTLEVTFPDGLEEGERGVLHVWIKLWGPEGLADVFTDEEADPTADGDEQDGPLTTSVFWTANQTLMR